MDTLYFDGHCPLCTREMDKLRRMKGAQLKLRDIHALSRPPEGKTTDELLRTLHLQRASGQWLTGFDANVAAWQHCGLGWAVRWMRWPLVRNIGRWLYAIWARRRYETLYGESCDSGGCQGQQ